MNDSPGESRVSDDPTELYGDSWKNRPVGWLAGLSSSPEFSTYTAISISLTAVRNVAHTDQPTDHTSLGGSQ
jgi:hypothetical protein